MEATPIRAARGDGPPTSERTRSGARAGTSPPAAQPKAGRSHKEPRHPTRTKAGPVAIPTRTTTTAPQSPRPPCENAETRWIACPPRTAIHRAIQEIPTPETPPTAPHPRDPHTPPQRTRPGTQGPPCSPPPRWRPCDCHTRRARMSRGTRRQLCPHPAASIAGRIGSRPTDPVELRTTEEGRPREARRPTSRRKATDAEGPATQTRRHLRNATPPTGARSHHADATPPAGARRQMQ
jgi:hypothetical protein